jgi:hypothetical protein
MKSTILLLFLFISSLSYAQKTADVSTGSIGIGLHLACPQSELKDIQYDDGFGLNLSYLSRKYPYKSFVNFQVGARMDFANMQNRKFDSIQVVIGEDGELAAGGATVSAKNRMYGLFAFGRINFGNDESKIVPYVDLLAGHRNYTTYQILDLNQPESNPTAESQAITQRIVHTKRFHYGGSVGLNYRVSPQFSLETSVTYTFGETGAALPLGDIIREDGGNEIDYSNYQSVKTDMLLINAGIRIHLFKNYAHQSNNPNTNTNPNTPTNTRYKDNTPTRTPTRDTPTTDDPVIRGRNTTPTAPVKKQPIKIRSDGPKKDKNDKS